MANSQEKRAVELLCERLSAAFPEVSTATVRLAIEQAHRAFDGCRVRQYVPVLVERAAREMLATTPTLALPVIPFEVHQQLLATHELWRVMTSRNHHPARLPRIAAETLALT